MKNIFLFIFLFVVLDVNAQVGIATNSPKSTLDINGSVSYKVATITTNSTLDSTNSIVLCNNSTLLTVTLPSAVSVIGRVYTIKNINTALVLISAAPGQTVDGASSASLSAQYESMQIISNGSNWYILNKKQGAHYIGESYGGGIIFYLEANGNHGLIAANSDQSTGIKWNNTGANAGEYFYAQLQGMYSGKANTQFITSFNFVSTTYAASICSDLVIGAYDDWYLPSIEELNTMYRNLYMQGLGNFTASAFYWSSTAYQNTNEGAYGKFFATGDQIVDDITDLNCVRAVRSF